LNGNKEIITKKIEEDMIRASENLNYEKALELKNLLEDINITLAKQRIDLNKKCNLDLFGFYNDKNYLSIQVFFIRDGILFGHHSDIYTYYGDSSDAVLEYIIKYYEKGNIIPKEIAVSNEIDTELLSNYLNTKVFIPKKGDLKNLIELSTSNAKMVLDEKMSSLKQNDDKRLEALKDLEKALGFPVHRIETFDNSHLFGTFYVSGMVVFDDFLPNKNLYRKFKISTEVKDDLSAMKEVIYRRYFRVLMDNLEKPDLIIVDGGETQVSVAKEIIDSLGLDIKIIGLKKNEKHRTSSIIDWNLNTIEIDVKSNLFLFLTKIQDEVHNYAISYHRNIKTNGMLSSLLDMVDGIGEVRKKQLLKKYGSLKKIKEATKEELEEILSKKVADNLYEYIKKIDI
jgi:excinuclease ABC subunit C